MYFFFTNQLNFLIVTKKKSIKKHHAPQTSYQIILAKIECHIRIFNYT